MSSSDTQTELKPPLSRIRKLSVAFSTLVVTVLICELAARIYIFGAKAFDYRALEHFRTASKGGLYAPHEDPEILFQWAPNLRTQSRLTRLETNALGLRDREYPAAKGPDTLRIAALGDSFTAGTGVEAEQTWSALLETQLGRSLGSERVEVWNWGVSGYHVVQYVATAERRVVATDPDVIIVGYCAQNDNWAPPESWKPPYRVRPLSNGFLSLYSQKLLTTVTRKRTHYLRPEIPLTDENRVYLRSCFERLGTLSRERSIPVIVAYLNIYAIDCSEIRALVEQAGLEFVDASQHFSYDEVDRFTFLPIDYHPNALAHEVFADVIGVALQERGLVAK